jgi:DNA-binding MarR family transcriptional regulator
VEPHRWLSRAEWSAWLQLLATSTLLPAALDSHLQREAGMSHFEFSVLVALSRQPGLSLQLKDLAMVANGSISRLSHVISRLEERGWVQRASGPSSRATHAVLTNAGHQALMAAGPIHFRKVRRMVFDVLTPEEVKALEHVAGRINVGLLGEISLGKLAPGIRKRSVRQST